jgi:hypothetical protein
MKRIALIAFFLAAATACSDDDVCSTDSDCFSGESCSAGRCVTPNADTGNNTANNSANGSTPNSANGSTPNSSNVSTNNSSNATTPNAGNANTGNNSTSTNNLNPNNGGASCEVDPFTATCEDDEWEENDRIDFEEALPVDSGLWCTGGTLNSMTSFRGTFCAGDQLDLYRILIDNRTPDQCLQGPFTLTIDVRILQNCNPARIQVEPYTFFSDPRSNDLCADDDNVRCSSFDNGQGRRIEWLREADQLNDFYLLIGNDENNVQFDYEVTLTVTP